MSGTAGFLRERPGALLIETTLLTAAFVAAGWLYFVGSYLNHDSVWLVVAAERMLAGGDYLRDFFEVNPPMSILLHMPALTIAWLTGLDPFAAYTAQVMIMILGTWALLRLVLARGAFRGGGGIREWLPVTAAAVLLLLTRFDFGQREHLVVILVLPWLVLRAAFPADRAAPPWLAIAVAAWASPGFFVKPVFVLLPATVALVQAWRHRRLRALFAPDILVIGILGTAYIVLTLLLFPEFLEVFSFGLAYYDAYNSKFPGVILLAVPHVLLAAAPLALRWLSIGDPEEHRLAGLLAGAAAAAALSAGLQMKGWPYHYLPVQLFATVAVLVALTILGRALAARMAGRAVLVTARVVPALFLALLALISARDLQVVSRDSMQRSALYAIMADVAPGKSLFVFSSSVQYGLTWVTAVDARWGSRFSCLWLLPGHVAAVDRGAYAPAQAAAVAADLRGKVVEDFERFRPEIVLVDRGAFKQGFKRSFEFLPFFAVDARFARLWRDYEYVDSADGMDVYRYRGRPDRASSGLP